MVVTVREVTHEDLGEIAAIWHEIHPNEKSPDTGPLISRIDMSLTTETFKLIGAWDAQGVVGIACVSLVDVGTWSELAAVQISGLHVVHHARRRGVAKAILNNALAYADKWGCSNIMASVPPQEREANRFFARLGFAPIATRRITETSALRRKISDEPSRVVSARLRRRTRDILGGELRVATETGK